MSAKSKQVFLRGSLVFFILLAIAGGLYRQKLQGILGLKGTPSSPSSLNNTVPELDSQSLVRMRELIDQKAETLRDEYKKAGTVATDEWKQFGARLNLDLKSEFIHLDQAIKQKYSEELPPELKEQRAMLDRYSNDLLFVWREMNSQLSKYNNQLSVAAKILSKTAEDAKASLPSASQPIEK